MRDVYAGQFRAPDSRDETGAGGRGDRRNCGFGGSGRNDGSEAVRLSAEGREAMTLNQDLVAEITREVVARLQAQMQQAAPVSSNAEIRDGVFPTVDDAVKAAAAAQLKVGQLSLDERAKAVAIIKRMCEENAD